MSERLQTQLMISSLSLRRTQIPSTHTFEIRVRGEDPEAFTFNKDEISEIQHSDAV